MSDRIIRHSSVAIFRLLVLLFLSAVAGCAADTSSTWTEAEGYRWVDLRVDGRGAGFRSLSPEQTGLSFVNTLRDDQLLANRHTMNGSGVAAGDVDGDGWTDLYFARLDGPNVLYRNLGGWRFEDVTDSSGVAAPGRLSTGAVFADIDGDGDLDLLVTAMGGPNAAFRNDGTGRFSDITETAGLSARRGSTTMTLADVDGDGDLDLYVGNYKTRSVNDLYPPYERTMERTVVRDGDTFRPAPAFEAHYAVRVEDERVIRLEIAEPDLFYLNDGHGLFSPVPFTDGRFLDADGTSLTEPPAYWTLTARFQDVNGDGLPDLYVCNDFESPDLLWFGDGEGTFRAAPPLTLRKTSLSTMSVDASDVDRDGLTDLFLTDMLSGDYTRRQRQVGMTVPMPTAIGEFTDRPQVIQNTLFHNRGDGTFAEVARAAGVAASEWSWSGLFLDVDLDGFEDLLVTTGHLYDVQDADAQEREIARQSTVTGPDAFRRLLLDFPPLPLPNVAFRNRGDLSFEPVADAWGFGRDADVAQGFALADLDRDGDLDAVTNRLRAPAGVYRNDAEAPRLAVRLRGRSPNTQGIGAVIYVTGGPAPQQKEVVSGGQYLSGSDPLYSFSASGADSLRIEVRWRSGARTRIDGVQSNRMYEIDEPAAPSSTRPAAQPAPTPTFEEYPAYAPVHVEPPFDDFARQPLLPHRLSRLGPAVAFADLDADGDDDLLLGNGRTGRLLAARNDGTGRFSEVPLSAELTDDVAGLVALPRARGGALVFAAVTNYEGGFLDSSRIDVYDVAAEWTANPTASLPFGAGSVGPLALTDVDGDGDLDLFAGARTVPGRFPEAAPSRIYLNHDGSFRYDAASSAPFADAGMVSAAVFGDLDGDGDADGVLATDWGPLRVYRNDGEGRFTEWTADLGLGAYTGWWNGVALIDADADGRLDLLASNAGWNTVFGPRPPDAPPLRLYAMDFDADGVLDPVEAVFEPARDAYVPQRGLSLFSQTLPYVRSRTPTYRQFADATLREILGPKLDRAAVREASTLSHLVLLNRIDGTRTAPFVARVLPRDAQFSTAYGVTVNDMDGDGREDVFLSQNDFAVPDDRPRQDAGRGLWLRGLGDGTFTPIPGQASGVTVYGEQRGTATSDLDGDGRSDLVVTQNGARTRIFRNRGGTPGLRVRLVGPPENPTAIGAVVRLLYTDGTAGPVRAVTAGSGYWSQDTAVPVLGRALTPAAVRVRWPNGRTTEMPVAEEATEILVRQRE